MIASFTTALLAMTAGASDPPPRTLDELRTRIATVLESTRTPGVGLAIVRHDSVIFAGGIGKARVAPATPATERTLFRIASTSKAFVSLVVLQLAQEGKLSLDDPISKHLPGFYHQNPWAATDPVRVVHLLESTTGWDDASIKTYTNSEPTRSLEQALAMDSSTRVSGWRPGTHVSYGNTGPAVAARIVEVIEGRAFEDVVQARLFGPAGMRTATYRFPDTTRVPLATVYAGESATPVPYWHLWYRSSGGISASALDMAACLRLLLGRGTMDGRMIVPAAAIERMERSERSDASRAGLRVGYGLHLYRAIDSTGFAWVGHGGGIPGGLSDLGYLPEHGVGYAVQINTDSRLAHVEIVRLVRDFLTQGLPVPARPPAAPVPAAVRARFTGWYRPLAGHRKAVDPIQQILGLVHVSIGESTMTFAPLLSTPRNYAAFDSLRFRHPRNAEPSVALMTATDDSGRPQLIVADDGVPIPLEQLAAPVALLRLTLGTGFVLSIPVALLACLVGLMRRAIAKVRQRPVPALPAAALWRTAAVASGLLLTIVVVLSMDTMGKMALGTASPQALTMYGSGLAFAGLSLVGLLIAVRRRTPATRWQRASLFAARAALLVQAVGAAYLTATGFIGWRPWA